MSMFSYNIGGMIHVLLTLMHFEHLVVAFPTWQKRRRGKEGSNIIGNTCDEDQQLTEAAWQGVEREAGEERGQNKTVAIRESQSKETARHCRREGSGWREPWTAVDNKGASSPLVTRNDKSSRKHLSRLLQVNQNTLATPQTHTSPRTLLPPYAPNWQYPLD